MTGDLRERIARAGGLVNQGDLTRLWEISRQRVSQLCAAPGFPEPVALVGGRPVWTALDVQAWREGRAHLLAHDHDPATCDVCRVHRTLTTTTT